MTGTLYLLPTPLGNSDAAWLLPQDREQIRSISHFIVENAKTARKHLKLLNIDTPIQQVTMAELNEHTDSFRLPELLQPLLDGNNVALMSEAGCPAIADPGAALVALAHSHKITVKPLTGASSILMALMVSGANGQKFAFNGYLPADPENRKNALKTLEKKAKTGETQLFIETPYRNMAMLQDAIAVLSDTTHLCTAANLTQATETIISQSIAQWKTTPLPDLKKRPCVFVVF